MNELFACGLLILAAIVASHLFLRSFALAVLVSSITGAFLCECVSAIEVGHATKLAPISFAIATVLTLPLSACLGFFVRWLVRERRPTMTRLPGCEFSILNEAAG